MSIVEDLSSEQSATRWGKPILIAGGLVWIGRAALETIFRHDYWNPQTAVDYTAVAGFSLALFLLSLGLWAIHRGRNPQTGLRKRLWFAGIGLACSGAPLAGISAIGAGDLPRWTSWLFFARALGLGTIDSGGDSFRGLGRNRRKMYGVINITQSNRSLLLALQKRESPRSVNV